MPSKRLLKQATLFGPRGVRSGHTTSKVVPAKGKSRSGRVLLLQQDTDDDDDDSGLASIKLQPKVANTSEDELDVRKGRSAIPHRDDTRDSNRETHTEKRKHSHDSTEDEPRPRQRRILKSRRLTVSSSGDDDGDDDDDLVAEVEKDRIISNRLRSRDKKTPFQKSLEKLKRRKQGKPSMSTSSDDQSDEEGTDRDTPFKGAKPHSDYDSLFDEETDASNSSDFIIEDDGAVIAPLPTEFSMESYQDLDHQFKKIFQFFVHIAVRPAKERHVFMKEQLRHEEYFSVPLQMMRRKISGLRDSLVASSVWRPDFKKPLETYPEFDVIPLDFATPNCDACHLGGRMSTLLGRLSGMPYDRWGFEIKDNRDGNSDSSGDDESTVEFHLGRFCAKRTRVFHAFTHWEYSLFKCIRDEVDELHASRQSSGFFRIAYTGGKRPPEDLTDADGICEWLDERKVIDMQWEKIKDMMKSARHLELATKGGDDD